MSGTGTLLNTVDCGKECVYRMNQNNLKLSRTSDSPLLEILPTFILNQLLVADRKVRDSTFLHRSICQPLKDGSLEPTFPNKRTECWLGRALHNIGTDIALFLSLAAGRHLSVVAHIQRKALVDL